MAILIKTDGTIKAVHPKAKKFTLQELKSLVGGYVECIYLNDEFIVICNEEGKNAKLDVNKLATCMMVLSPPLPFNDFLVGDVVLTEVTELD